MRSTGGKVGYIYVRSTGRDAQNELVRQFAAQRTKDGLIIDERFNDGGQIPDRFIELLNRPTLSYWAVRDAPSVAWPPVAHRGPKVMLINGWSGSGGDAFPFYFREAALGPIIGSRTWGGLIGISGSPGLVDGGVVTVPSFRMYDPEGPVVRRRPWRRPRHRCTRRSVPAGERHRPAAGTSDRGDHEPRATDAAGPQATGLREEGADDELIVDGSAGGRLVACGGRRSSPRVPPTSVASGYAG